MKTNTIQEHERIIHEMSRNDALFAQAVDFIKNTNDITTRKAGVHILKELSIDSPRHTQKCLDLITSLNYDLF